MILIKARTLVKPVILLSILADHSSAASSRRRSAAIRTVRYPGRYPTDHVEHDHKGGLNFQPAVLVQVGQVGGVEPKTISGDPHSPLPRTLPNEE